MRMLSENDESSFRITRLGFMLWRGPPLGKDKGDKTLCCSEREDEGSTNYVVRILFFWRRKSK